MALLRSLVFSLLASILATLTARSVLALIQPVKDGAPRRNDRPIVVVVPILVGNSNNRIGWVKEVHYHDRSLLGRKRR